LRNPPHGEAIVPGFEVELYQSGVGANKCVPFPIRLDALCPTDGFESDGKLFETVARQLVESEVPSNQKRAIGSIAKGSARSGRNPLLRAECLEVFSVVPKNTIFRAYPNEAHAVLVDLPDREVVEALSDPEGAEIVFLGGRDAGGQHEENEQAHFRWIVH